MNMHIAHRDETADVQLREREIDTIHIQVTVTRYTHVHNPHNVAAVSYARPECQQNTQTRRNQMKWNNAKPHLESESKYV